MDEKNLRRKRRRSLRLHRHSVSQPLYAECEDGLTDQAECKDEGVSVENYEVLHHEFKPTQSDEFTDLGSTWLDESPPLTVKKRRGRRSNNFITDDICGNVLVSAVSDYSDIELSRAPDNIKTPESDNTQRSQTPVLIEADKELTPSLTSENKSKALITGNKTNLSPLEMETQLKKSASEFGLTDSPLGKGSKLIDRMFDSSSVPYSPSQPVFQNISPLVLSPLASGTSSLYSTPVACKFELPPDDINTKRPVDSVETKEETTDKPETIKRKVGRPRKLRESGSTRKSGRKRKVENNQKESSGRILGFLSVCKSLAGRLSTLVKPSPESSPSCSSLGSDSELLLPCPLGNETEQVITDMGTKETDDCVFNHDKTCIKEEKSGHTSSPSELIKIDVNKCSSLDEKFDKYENSSVHADEAGAEESVCRESKNDVKESDFTALNNNAETKENCSEISDVENLNKSECGSLNDVKAEYVDSRSDEDKIVQFHIDKAYSSPKISEDEMIENANNNNIEKCEITEKGKSDITKKCDVLTVELKTDTILEATTKYQMLEEEKISHELDEYLDEVPDISVERKNKRRRRRSADFYVSGNVNETIDLNQDTEDSNEERNSRKSTRLRRKSFELCLATNSALAMKENMKHVDESSMNENDNVDSTKNENVKSEKDTVRYTKVSRKRKLGEKELSLEEIYRNKNYKQPEEKKWETIYESPLKSKNSDAVQSKMRYKRAVTFEVLPASKLKRRVQKAAKNGWDQKKRKKQTLADDYVLEKLAEIDEMLLE